MSSASISDQTPVSQAATASDPAYLNFGRTLMGGVFDACFNAMDDKTAQMASKKAEIEENTAELKRHQNKARVMQAFQKMLKDPVKTDREISYYIKCPETGYLPDSAYPVLGYFSASGFQPVTLQTFEVIEKDKDGKDVVKTIEVCVPYSTENWAFNALAYTVYTQLPEEVLQTPPANFSHGGQTYVKTSDVTLVEFIVPFDKEKWYSQRQLSEHYGNEVKSIEYDISNCSTTGNKLTVEAQKLTTDFKSLNDFVSAHIKMLLDILKGIQF